MKNKIHILLIIVLYLSGCSKNNLTESNPTTTLEGKWSCTFTNQSPFYLSYDTLISKLQFYQNNFTLEVNKLNDTIVKSHYEGSYTIFKDTLIFTVLTGRQFKDKYIYNITNDSMNISVADTVVSGDLIFVRNSSFLWNSTENKIGGTFIRSK